MAGRGKQSATMQTHTFDVIVVGAGGAGLMAALYASQGGAKVAVVSKLYPTRSHTGTAQGGIGAALGNLEEDRWEWHAFDTVKGGDYLADQNAVRVLAQKPSARSSSWSTWACPSIATRRHDQPAPLRRAHQQPDQTARAAGLPRADRTGHMTCKPVPQGIKNHIQFFDEFHAVDQLLSADGPRAGIVAVQLGTGELHVFHSKAVIWATGGWGRVWSVTSNAHSLTGDGPAVLFRRGLPLKTWNFSSSTRPACTGGRADHRGRARRGRHLLNSRGERFMERYAPTIKDLASRDVISRQSPWNQGRARHQASPTST